MGLVAENFDERYDEITGQIAQVMGVINAANGELVDLLGHAQDEGLWDVCGIHSPGQWVGWQTGMAPARAQAVAKIVERHHELPTAVGALKAGELSLDALIEVARRAPANYERDITQYAKDGTITQLRNALRDYAYDPDTEAAKPKPREETRGVSSGTDTKGWWLKGRLDEDEGAVVDKALQTMLEDLNRQARDAAAEGEEPDRVTMADALTAMGEGALRAGEAAFPGSDRYRIHLHLDHHGGGDAGASESDDDPQLRFHLGGAVPAGLRSLLLCDAALRATVWDGATPLNVGRLTRVISRRMRRAIEHRDGGCRVPGCGRIHGLEIHHIVHWEHGGPTDTANLVTLCRFHHRIHHTGQLGIVGNADLRTEPGEVQGQLDETVLLHPTAHPLRFIDERGKVLPRGARPQGTPPDVDAAEAAADRGIVPTKPYEHPLGERQQRWGLHFNPNPLDPDPSPDDADVGEPSGDGGVGGRPEPTAMPPSARDGGPPSGTSPPA